MAADPLKALKAAKAAFDTKHFATALTLLAPVLHHFANLDAKELKKKHDIYYQSLLLAGLIHYHSDNYTASEDSYQRALSLLPLNYPAYRALTELYGKIEDYGSDSGVNEKHRSVLQRLLSLPNLSVTPVHLQHYHLDYAERLLRARMTAEARSVLYPLVSLDVGDYIDSNGGNRMPNIEDFVQPSSAPPLPSRFYRMFLSLHLQLDELNQATELQVRVLRQLKKLHETRIKEQEAKEKDDKKKLDVAKKQGIKLVEKKLTKEELSEMKLKHDNEEHEIRTRVKAKLDNDWLKTENVFVDRLYQWCCDSGMTCDPQCHHHHHSEHQLYIERKLAYYTSAIRANTGDQSLYACTMAGVRELLAQMIEMHGDCQWAIERLRLLDLSALLDGDGKKSLVREIRNGIHRFPQSWMLRHSYALLLTSFNDENLRLAQNNQLASKLISVFTAPYTNTSTNTVALSTPFLPLYHFHFLSLFCQYKQCQTSQSVQSLTNQTLKFVEEMKCYLTDFPYDSSARQCVVVSELLLGELHCYRGVDTESLALAESIFGRYANDASKLIGSVSAMGLLKVALYRRSYHRCQSLIDMLATLGHRDYAYLLPLLQSLLVYYQYLAFLNQERENVVPVVSNERLSVSDEWRQRLLSAYHSLSDQYGEDSDLFPSLLLKAQLCWLLSGDYRTDKELFYRHLMKSLECYFAIVKFFSSSSLTLTLFNSAECFALFGQYIESVLNDSVKAQAFYQKSLSIQPSNHTAANRLIRLLRARGQTKTIVTVCESAIADDKKCVWAYRIIGRQAMIDGQHSDSIAAYQHAIRIMAGSSSASGGTVNHSSLLWEELGQSYFNAGSYIAAMKAWTKASQINDKNLVAKFGIANIYRIQGMGSEAIATVKEIIAQHEADGSDRDSDDDTSGVIVLDDIDSLPRYYSPYIPSLRLIAESYYTLATNELQLGAYTSAIAQLNECVDVANKCLATIDQSGQLQQSLGILKLLGDAHALFHLLPCDQLIDIIAHKQRLAANDSAAITAEPKKLGLLMVADQYYERAIAVQPKLATLHYDRGVNLRQAMLLCRSDCKINELRSRALQSLKSAVTLGPENCYHWCALGLTLQSYVSRHQCLVQALKSSHRQPQAWLHLALIYLQHGDGVKQSVVDSASGKSIELTRINDGSAYIQFESARLSLELAQTIDSEHPTLWLTQGLFNTVFVNDSKVRQQAQECFSRSVEDSPLSYSELLDGRLGLAYTALVNGDMLLAAFHGVKVTEQQPSLSLGWTIRATTEIDKQQFQQAQQSLNNAKSLIESEGGDGDIESERRFQLRSVLALQSTVLFELGQHAESITLAQSVLELDEKLGWSTTDRRSLAIYHHLIRVYSHCQQYDEAKKVVIAAMGLITAEQSEDSEEVSERHSENLLASYHRIFLQFLDTLVKEANFEEALHHLQSKLDSENEDADGGESPESKMRTVDLYEQLITIQSLNTVSDSDAVTTTAEKALALIESDTTMTPLTRNQSMIRLRRAAIAALVQCKALDDAMTHVQQLAEMHVSLTLADKTFLVRAAVQHFPSILTAPSPSWAILRAPPLKELNNTNSVAIASHYAALSEAYAVTGKLALPSASLALEYEADEARRIRAEDTELLATINEAESEQAEKEEEEEEENSALAAVVSNESLIDDDVRHEYALPTNLLASSLESTPINTIAQSGEPTPSSSNALSAALKAVFVNPSAVAQWSRLASLRSAE